MRRCVLLVGLCALAGCNGSGNSGGAVAVSEKPVAHYSAMTTGTPDQMLMHIDELNAIQERTFEPTPSQARKARVEYCDAVIATAKAVLDRPNLIPQQSGKAAEAAIGAFARRADGNPERLNDLIEFCDDVMRKYPNTRAGSSAAFAKANAIGTAPDERYPNVDARMDDFVPAAIALGTADPPHPAAAEMLAKLTLQAEELGRSNDAKALYEVLRDKFPQNQAGQDASNRIRQLEQEGTVVSDFSGPQLDKSTLDLARLKGKVILVQFWTTGSDPSTAGFARLRLLREKYGRDDFEVVGVVVDESVDIARATIERKNVDWPQITETLPPSDPKSLQFRFGASTLPIYVVIDREGRVEKTSRSGLVAEKAIERLLAPPAPTQETEQAKSTP